MKSKVFILSIICLFLTSSLFSQNNSSLFILDKKDFIPQKTDIIKQCNELTHNNTKKYPYRIKGFKNDIILSESMVDSLLPIIDVNISPNTNKKTLFFEIIKDKILLWSPLGAWFSWIINDNEKIKPKNQEDKKQPTTYNLMIFGSNDRSVIIKDQINSALGQDYIFTLHFFPQERYYYPYIGYNENGKDIIKDCSGKIYNSLEELITDKFGSLNNYIVLYNKSIEKKLFAIPAQNKMTKQYSVFYFFNDGTYWDTNQACIVTSSFEKFLEEYTMII
jgi:hypothetical protein